MTVLYSGTFESLTTNAIAPGWVDTTNSFRAYTYTATGTTAIQGTEAFFSNAPNSWAVETGVGALTNQGVRHASRIAALTNAAFATVGAVLSSATSSPGSNQYRIYLATNNTGLRYVIDKYLAGSNVLATGGSYAFKPAPGDVVHQEFLRVGNGIEARAWLNNDTRPAVADGSASATYATAFIADASFASGYPGLFYSGAGSYVPVDNVVITDAAGGEDFFYQPVAIINLAAANLTTAATLSTAVVGVSAPVAGVVNLVAANLASAGTLSTAAVGVTQVQGTLTSDPFKAWGSPAPLTGKTIPRTVVLKASDGSLVLNLANQVTNGAGCIALVNAAIVTGSWYMMGNWDPADPVNNRGFKAYQAT